MNLTTTDRKHKVIIAGTGRCGTTFLIQLLTLLGKDTGLVKRGGSWYSHIYQKVTVDSIGQPIKVIRRPPNPNDHGPWPIYNHAFRAGCELHISMSDSAQDVAGLPKYIKNPRFAWMLEGLIEKGIISVEHIILPVRKLDSVAASKHEGRGPTQKWYQSELTTLRSESARQLGELMTTLVTRELPYTTILFPRLAIDPHYAYCRLAPIIGDIEFELFEQVFRSLSNPANITHSG